MIKTEKEQSIELNHEVPEIYYSNYGLRKSPSLYYINYILKSSLLLLDIDGRKVQGEVLLKRCFELLQGPNSRKVIEFINLHKATTFKEIGIKTLVSDSSLSYTLKELKKIAFIEEKGEVKYPYKQKKGRPAKILWTSDATPEDSKKAQIRYGELSKSRNRIDPLIDMKLISEVVDYYKRRPDLGKRKQILEDLKSRNLNGPIRVETTDLILQRLMEERM
jgi:hypothetical protein